MTPDAAKSSYRRQLAAHGETVSLRRYDSGNVPADYSVRARIMGASPSDVTGNVQQMRRKAIVLAEDVAAISFPTPFQPKRDRLLWAGKEITITAIDDATRRVGGVLIAYELELSGP